MIVKELKITNSNGGSIQFGRHFFLLDEFNLSNLKADISYSKSTKDGANYQRTVLAMRELDIPFYIDYDFRDNWWIEERRQDAFRVFNPKHNPMKLEFTTLGDKSYYLHANLETSPSFSQTYDDSNESWQKGLLQFSCDDPYIYEASSTVVEIASWIANFEFPLELNAEGIEMGIRSPSLIANVLNSGSSDTGMLIRFKALSSVSNPALINVNTYESFKLNFDMQGGDVIEVSTYVGKKTVTLIRNNMRSRLFSAVDLTSEFLQLSPGDNLFRYNADSGIDNLEVAMIFTPRMIGV